MFQDMAVWLRVVLSFAVALIVSYFMTPPVKGFAERVGAIDVPRDGRRVHDHPIPRMGGLAIFIGFVLILVCMKLLPKIEDFVTSKALNMNIYISMDSVECLGNIINCFKESNFRILDADIEKEEHATITQINAVFSVKMTERHPHTEILAKLSTLDGIIYIEQT